MATYDDDTGDDARLSNKSTFRACILLFQLMLTADGHMVDDYRDTTFSTLITLVFVYH